MFRLFKKLDRTAVAVYGVAAAANVGGAAGLCWLQEEEAKKERKYHELGLKTKRVRDLVPPGRLSFSRVVVDEAPSEASLTLR